VQTKVRSGGGRTTQLAFCSLLGKYRNVFAQGESILYHLGFSIVAVRHSVAVLAH
jgi:hypothetical protein